MNIFFDMDYTILEIDFGSLRPGVRELFENLKADGHTLYIWSGAGARPEEIRFLGLEDMVDGVFQKPWEDYERAVMDMLKKKEIPVLPDLVVDDCSGIVTALGGFQVPPFGARSRNDQEMERLYDAIRAYASNGHSHNSGFVPKSPHELDPEQE